MDVTSKSANQDLERELIPVGGCGKISYYKETCVSNKHGENPSTYKSHIFRGVFENKMLVCVRRFEASNSNQEKEKETTNQIFSRDIAVLQEPQHLHENFIRYLCSDTEGEFVFVATEWCICSVENLYGANRNEKNWAEEKIDSEIIKKSLGKKELLRQATEGLAFLHALGFVHRNLKPSNFLIAQLQQLRGFRYLVKLSDFRMSKNPIQCPEISGTTGSDGWTYPNKQPVNTEANISTYLSGDVFILGCFFHYVLTDGKHPFGDNKIVREKNMNNGHYSVYHNVWNVDFKKDDDFRVSDLLKQMIKFNLSEICALDKVFGFLYFAPLNFYDLYDLPDVKPGLCVIFNQEIFENEKDNRNGSELDEKALQDVFLDLGFDVNIYKNLKKKDLCYAINELTKKDFSSYASLIVCILSHGDEGVVEGVDGETIKINDELKYKFNSNDCPSLNGKPKIWIIQACQGKGRQYPIQLNCSEASGASSKSDSTEDTDQQQFNYKPVSKQKKETPTSNLKRKISRHENLNKRPPLMDFLDIRGSIPGYVSYRGKNYGSLLIQFLCIELKEEYLDKAPNKENKSLEDVLKNLQNHINSKTITNEFNIEVKQTIEWRASLSDRIAFKKAETRGVLTFISIPDQPSEGTDWLTRANEMFAYFYPSGNSNK